MELSELIRARRARERGAILKDAPIRVTLAYPNTYKVGMASLGFQVAYKLMNAEPDAVAERVFLEELPGELITYESGRRAGEAEIFAVSIAYELDLTNLARLLVRSRIEPLREKRDERDPLVIVGGPLTSSNPWPLAPFADVILIGDGEETIPALFEAYRNAGSKTEFLDLIEGLPGVFLPDRMTREPHFATARPETLPAAAQFVTPDAEFPNTFLIEVERGCPRPCTFCLARVMYGPTRNVPLERVLAAIPEDVPKVGLIGAALTDYPWIKELSRALVERGQEFSYSSIRADRVDLELAELMRAGGMKSFTFAADGPSQRLRDLLKKQITTEDLLRTAKIAREAGFRRFKLYQMIGLPTETEADLEEMVELTVELSQYARLALTVSPFVPKRHTPHFADRFAGVKTIEKRLKFIAKKLGRHRARVELRSVSARWAWVEAVIARGGPEVGLAALRLVERENYARWREALSAVGWNDPLNQPEPAAPAPRVTVAL